MNQSSTCCYESWDHMKKDTNIWIRNGWKREEVIRHIDQAARNSFQCLVLSFKCRKALAIHCLPKWAFSALWYMASCRALICPLFSLTTCSFSLLPLLPDTAGSLPPEAADVVPYKFIHKHYYIKSLSSPFHIRIIHYISTACINKNTRKKERSKMSHWFHYLPVGNERVVSGQMLVEKLLPPGSLLATGLQRWRSHWPDVTVIYAWRHVDHEQPTRRWHYTITSEQLYCVAQFKHFNSIHGHIINHQI